MNDAQREEVALFRFGVISELVATRLEYGAFERLVKQKSAQRWNIPGSKRTRISPSTIRRWVRRYQANGGELAALYPAARSDRGKSRTVDDETIGALVKLRTEQPTTPARSHSDRDANARFGLSRRHPAALHRLSHPRTTRPFRPERARSHRSPALRGRIPQ